MRQFNKLFGYVNYIEKTFLVKTTNHELQTLGITIELGDKLNKNAIASVDRAQQELELELKKLSPECDKVSPALLARAVQNVNMMIRNQGLSAYEVHYSREQLTGDNLNLNDVKGTNHYAITTADHC